MAKIKRIGFFEDLGGKRATIAYFLQEGPKTCNASCKGCYAGAGEISFHPDRGIINPEEAYADISELIKEHRVLIRGTEVLINPEYIPLLKLANNKIVLTNGIILGRFPERLDLLADNDVSNIAVTYPFESTPATYRNLSGLLHQRKTIQTGIENIKQHDFSFVLQLSAIITRDCMERREDLESICKEARSLGANVLRFIPYVPMSGNPLVDCYALSEEERKALVERVTALKRKYAEDELVIHTPGVLGLFPLRAEKKKGLKKVELSANKLICPAGKLYFAISAIKRRGENSRMYRPITPCHFRMDAEIGRYYEGLYINKEKIAELFVDMDRRDCPAQRHWYKVSRG